MGENLAAACGDDEIVFDANAADPREINSGLDRDHLAGTEYFGARRSNARPFVDLHADAMPEGVREILPESRSCDVLSRSSIDGARFGARSHKVEGGLLCGTDNVISSAKHVMGSPQKHGPGDIGAVPGHDASEIKENRIPPPQGAPSGSRVRHCCARAGGHDRLEAVTLRTEPGLAIRDLESKLAFLDPGSNQR